MKIRDLEDSDYDKGYLQLLSELTQVGEITKEQFTERLNKMKESKSYIIKVIVDEQENVVGTGTLFIEHKFIHECASKGHIEDIVIHESCRGKHVGMFLIQELIKISKEMGCYKTALCCRDDVVKFYEKCGLECKEVEMVVYHSAK